MPWLSISTWFTPRALACPSQTKLKVWPPSVVFHRPQAAASGASDTEPPVTEETPRTPRVVPTYIVLGLFGSITIDEIERAFIAAGLPGRSVQLLPLSWDA